MLVNSSSQKHEEYNGVIDIFDSAPDGGGFIRRSTFDRTTLLINQLLGEHKLTEKINFDWGVSYNTVKGDMPDRTQNKMFFNRESGIYNIAQNTITDNQEIETCAHKAIKCIFRRIYNRFATDVE